MGKKQYTEQVHLKIQLYFSVEPFKLEPRVGTLFISLEEPLNCICTQVTHFFIRIKSMKTLRLKFTET